MILWMFVSIFFELASVALGFVIIGVAIYFMFRIPLTIVRRLSFRCPHCNVRCPHNAPSCPHCGKNLSSNPFSTTGAATHQ
jgi:rRNA maturation endonuclease Nob1